MDIEGVNFLVGVREEEVQEPPHGGTALGLGSPVGRSMPVGKILNLELESKTLY